MLTFFFLPFFLSLNVHAEAPKAPREGTYEVKGTFTYFSSTENYTSGGTQTLLNGGQYTNALGDLRFTYDWQADWRFYASLNFARADSALASNMGVNEVMAGAQKWFEAGKFDLASEVEFVYPAWRVDESSDSPLLGEGAIRLKAGSWAFYPMKKIKPFAYVGFEYRDEGRASIIPYNLGVKGRIQRFWLQGELRGYERIIDDADSGNIINKTNTAVFLQRADSGSTRYYAINPSYSELAVEGGTRYGDWGVFAGFAYSVNGQNTASGWTGYGGLTWAPKAAHRPGDKRDEVFAPRGEKYDENVFRESTPSKPPPEGKEPEFNEPNPAVAPGPDEAAPPEDNPRSGAPNYAPEYVPPSKAEVQLEIHRVKTKKLKAKIKAKKKIKNELDDAESFLEKKK